MANPNKVAGSPLEDELAPDAPPLRTAGTLLARAFNARLDSERFADKRGLLIAHGIRLFHRKGVNGTGVAELLAEANMGKGQFYHYFESKEDFVCAVLRHEMDFFLKHFSPIMADLPGLDGFEQWFEPYLGLADLPDNLGCPVGVIACEMSGSSAKVRETAAANLLRWTGAMAQGLRCLQSHLPMADDFIPELAAEYIASTIQGALLLGRTFRSNRYILQARGEVKRYLEGARRTTCHSQSDLG